jgi:ATP-dependent exoDNAse (exonuclease V) alpha subunit
VVAAQNASRHGKVVSFALFRRLLYVAMTRAKHHLDIIVPQRFFVLGG